MTRQYNNTLPDRRTTRKHKTPCPRAEERGLEEEVKKGAPVRTPIAYCPLSYQQNEGDKRDIGILLRLALATYLLRVVRGVSGQGGLENIRPPSAWRRWAQCKFVESATGCRSGTPFICSDSHPYSRLHSTREQPLRLQRPLLL